MFTYKKKIEVKERVLNETFLIYNPQKSIVLKLNESAKVIWLLLLEGYPEKEIISNYALCYNIDHETAKKDVKKVINELLEKDFIARVGVNDV